MEVVRAMELCLEQIGGMVEFPMTLFTEGQFMHIPAQDKIAFFSDVLSKRKWFKPQTEGKPLQLDKGK